MCTAWFFLVYINYMPCSREGIGLPKEITRKIKIRSNVFQHKCAAKVSCASSGDGKKGNRHTSVNIDSQNY